MKCSICQNISKHIFTGKLLNKYDVKYYHCKECGFMQTEEPFWMEEAYDDAINDTDIGLLSRNIHLSKKTKIIIHSLFSAANQKNFKLFRKKWHKKCTNKLYLRKKFINYKFRKLYSSGISNTNKYIDFGGGFGIFVRLVFD